MSLPIFQSEDKDLMMMQSKWAAQLNPLLNLPTNKITVLFNVSLKAGQLNQVNHRLGRNLIGWFITRKRSQGDVWDSQDSNQLSDKTLALNVSADMLVDIGVF